MIELQQRLMNLVLLIFQGHISIQFNDSYAANRFLLTTDHCSSFSTRSRPALPIHDLRFGSSISSEIALAKASSSLHGTKTAASCAENRVSFRSNETIGLLQAMYSITLIHVETSFSGLDGSGSTQISAAATYSCKSSSEIEPANSTLPSNFTPRASWRKSYNEAALAA